MSRFRCSGCREYFRVEEAFLSNGLGRVCSENCLRTVRDRVRSRPVKRKPDVPADVRQRVFARDGHRCRYCGSERSLMLHHIDYRSEGGPHEEWNLIALCAVHHELVHSDKRRFQPLLKAYVWVRGVESRMLFVPQLERLLTRMGSQ